MIKANMLCTGFINLCILSSCASLKPPVRPDYHGTDVIRAAQPSQLIGSWVVHNLNPYPNEAPQNTIIEYSADGSLKGLVEPQGETSELLGNIKFELTGNWLLEGDMIKHSNIELNSSSDNAMGAMISKALGNSKNFSGTGNIYELSANRMIIVGEDGAATEYIRQ